MLKVLRCSRREFFWIPQTKLLRAYSKSYIAQTEIVGNIHKSITSLSNDFDTKVDFSCLLEDVKASVVVDDEIVIAKAKEITCSNQFNSSIVDLLLNLILFNLQSKCPPQKEALLYLADLLTLINPDFRTMINYKLLLDELTKIRYFETKEIEDDEFIIDETNISIWEFFHINFKPFLSINKLENYNHKLTKFLELLKFIETNNARDPKDYKSLQKLLYPTLVDMIRDSILLNDTEFAVELLSIYKTQFLNDNYLKKSMATSDDPHDTILFDKVPSEDYHTFIYSLLESPNKEVLKILLHDEFIKGIDLSDYEKDQVLVLLARYGLTEEFLKLLNKSAIELNEMNLSLVTELVFKDLGVDQTVNLIEQTLKERQLQHPSYQDYKFITNYLKDEIMSMSINRKQFTPRDPKSPHKHAKLFIQRVDINDQLTKYGHILNSTNFSNQSKALLMNCLLKAVSSVTNSTGLIHLYLKLPQTLVNTDSITIMMHAFTRGTLQSHFLRVSELWNFAKKQGTFDMRALEFIIEFCLNNSNETEDLEFETMSDKLINEALDSCEWKATDKMVSLFIKNKKTLNVSSKDIQNRDSTRSFKNALVDMDLTVSYEQVKDHIRSLKPKRSNEFPKLIKNTKKFNEFDVKESKLLRRHHSKSPALTNMVS